MNAKTILILWDEKIDDQCLAHRLYEEILRINEDSERKCEDLQVFFCKTDDFDSILEKYGPKNCFVLLPTRFVSASKVMRVFVSDPALIGPKKPVWGATFSTNLRNNRQAGRVSRIPHIAAQVHAWVRKGTDEPKPRGA